MGAPGLMLNHIISPSSDGPDVARARAVLRRDLLEEIGVERRDEVDLSLPEAASAPVRGSAESRSRTPSRYGSRRPLSVFQ